MSSSQTPEQKLYLYCKNGDTERVTALLQDHPEVNVNWKNPESGCTPLYIACKKRKSKVVKILLAHPRIDPNEVNSDGETALHNEVRSEWSPVLEILLRDSGVDVNKPDGDNNTPLFYACQFGKLEHVKYIIALRGMDIDLTIKGTVRTPTRVRHMTAYEVCFSKFPMQNNVIIHILLGKFQKDRRGVIYELRKELGIYMEEDITELFSTIVLLCDGYLIEKQLPVPKTGTESFFSIAKRVPIEHQMLLSHKAYGSAKEIVLSKDSEKAFKKILN